MSSGDTPPLLTKRIHSRDSLFGTMNCKMGKLKYINKLTIFPKYRIIISNMNVWGTNDMKNTVNASKKNGRGMKSLATMVVLVVFMLIAATAACLGGLGIFFLRQSMTESIEEHGFMTGRKVATFLKKKPKNRQRRPFVTYVIGMMTQAIYGLTARTASW